MFYNNIHKLVLLIFQIFQIRPQTYVLGNIGVNHKIRH